MKYIFIFFLVLGFTTHSFSACSNYIGKASINEVFVTGNNYFFEATTIDDSVNPPLPKNDGWKIYYCNKNQNNKCDTMNFNEATVVQLDMNRYYYVFPKGVFKNLGTIDTFQAVLLDGSNNPIDYVNLSGGSLYGNISSYTNTCSSFPYSVSTSPGSNNKHVYRGIDGNGPWKTNPATGNTAGSDVTEGTNNNRSSICDVPDLNITKSVSLSTPNVGDEITYSITVGNNGCTGTNATLTDTLDSKLTYVANSATVDTGVTFTSYNSGSNTLTWNISSIAFAVNKTVTFKATPNTAGTISNSAVVTEPNEFDATNNTSNSVDINVNLGKILYVDDSGGTGNSCGDSQFSTLKSALDWIVASGSGNGYTINICDGSYTETSRAYLNDSKFQDLTIKSVSGNRDNVVLDFSGNSNDAFYINQSGVTIKDMTISAYNDAIYVNESNVVVENLKISSSNNRGIVYSSNAFGTHTFSNINITSKNTGMDIDEGSDVTFSNVTVYSSSDKGIDLASSVSGNHVFSNIDVNSSREGIGVDSGGQTFSNINIHVRDSGDGLNITGVGTSALTFSNITVVADNGDALEIGSDHTNNTVISNYTSTSSNYGIYIIGSNNVTMSSVNVTSTGERGIYLQNANGEHSLTNVTVDNSGTGNASKHGIVIDDGGKTFSNVTITTSGKGLELGNTTDISFSNLNINSTGNIALDLTATVSGNHSLADSNLTTTSLQGLYARASFAGTINNVTINSQEEALYFSKNTGGGDLSITNVDITNTDYYKHAIYLSADSGGDITIDNVVINSDGIGIYANNANNMSVNNVCIEKAHIGMQFNSNVSNLTVSNSIIDGFKNGEYGLDLKADTSNKATIYNNCFKSSNTKKAYSNSGNHTFYNGTTGNYWEGTTTGSYSDGNVFDPHILTSCSVSIANCSSAITPNLDVNISSPSTVNSGGTLSVDVNISNTGTEDTTSNFVLTFPFGSDDNISVSSITGNTKVWNCTENATTIVCTDSIFGTGDFEDFVINFAIGVSPDKTINATVTGSGGNGIASDNITFFINGVDPVVADDCSATFAINNFTDGSMGTRVAGSAFNINAISSYTCVTGNPPVGSLDVLLDIVDATSNTVLETLGTKSVSTINSVHSITVNSAYKSVKIKASFDGNISYSDPFSIRPNSLIIDENGNSNFYISGDTYRYLISTSPTSGYSSNSLSVSVQEANINISDANMEFDYLLGTIDSSTADNYFDFNYTDIGNLELNVTDLTWTAIDSAITANDCTKDYDDVTCSAVDDTCSCYLRGVKNNIQFKPFSFAVTGFSLGEEPSGASFIPLANGGDYNGTISATIQAINSLGNITENYSSTLYGNSVVVEINGTQVVGKNIHFIDDNNSIKTYSGFLNGVLNFQRSFNFYRDSQVPQNPFTVSGNNDINITIEDSIYGLKDSNSSAGGSLDFYYMRINPVDISTKDSPAVARVYYEVYSTSDIGTESVDSLNWYQRRPDNSVAIPTFGYSRSDGGNAIGVSAVGDYDNVSFATSGGTKIRIDVDLSDISYLFYNPYSTTPHESFYVEFLNANINGASSSDLAGNRKPDNTRGVNRLGE